MGSIQSALLGYGFFRVFQKCGFGKHFTVAENAIIQTTSVAVATMPITAGNHLTLSHTFTRFHHIIFLISHFVILLYDSITSFF